MQAIKILPVIMISLLLVGGFLLVAQTGATTDVTIVVNTLEDELNDDEDCSLREAIRAANLDSEVDACPAGSGNDIIELPAGVFSLTVAGSNEDQGLTGDLDISTDMQIYGNGSTSTTIRSDVLDRVFHITGPVEVELAGLSIEQGDGVDEGGGIYNAGVLTLTQILVNDNESVYYGGGIYNTALGSLTVLTSTVSQNNVTDIPAAGCMGGGIYSEGTLVVQASSLIDNSAYCAGGINNLGVMTMTNSTVSGNFAAFAGGMQTIGDAYLINATVAYNEARDAFATDGGLSGQATLVNTIVAHNLGGNCDVAVDSEGHNIDSEDSCGLDQLSDFVNTDPLIGPLGDNGGETMTHALLTGSPAIDAGDDSACPTTDQRGFTRQSDGNGDGVTECDIGAYEVLLFYPTETTITSDEPDPTYGNQPFTVTTTVSSTVSSIFGTPTGTVTVTVSDSDATCGGGLVAGTSSCQLLITSPGTYDLQAFYAAESPYSSSTASEQHIVLKAPSMTAITSDLPDPSLVDENFEVSFEVTATYGIPTGKVSIHVSDTFETCSSKLVDGSGSCTLSISKPGLHTLTASYNGNAALLPSSDSEEHTVEALEPPPDDQQPLFLPLVLSDD